MNYFSQVINAARNGKSIPAEPKWNKWMHIPQGKSHCDECLRLNNCWFAKEKTPMWPHHILCHCVLDDVPYVKVMEKSAADCPYAKFDPYLFDPEGFYKHGKNRMFESWGYTVSDEKWLQNEIQKQGLEKYINGDYELGVLNEYGQRLSIRVEIPNRINGAIASFITGWMVYPNGQIILNTPYGGK